MLNRLLLPILLLSLSVLTAHAAPNPQSLISNLQSPITFTNATYLYGNVNGAPDGQERPYCSCSVLLEDYDGDGRTDIFAGNHLLPDVLYRNTNQGGEPHFANVARLVGLADPLGPRAAEGAVFGDVDNDGDLDLYVLSGNLDDEPATLAQALPSPRAGQGDKATRGQGEILPFSLSPPLLVTPVTDGFFLNQQAQTGQAAFLPAADQAGITVDTIPCGIAFLDLDNDGWLDIYRQGHHGQTVYLNQGDGTFQDVTAAWGVGQKFDSDAMGIAPADFDNDGDLDILIGAGPENPGEQGANVLLRNDGDRFVDVAAQVGLADTDSTFSATWGDYDSDGDLDLYLAKNGLYGTSTRNTLYRNDGSTGLTTGGGTFTDVTDQAGVGDDRVSTGAVFADFNNDGWLDLFVQNSGEPGWQRDTLYLNNGDGTFRDATREAGLGEENRYGYALSVGDVNGDGFLDIYNGHMAGQLNELWLNEGNENHWLGLRLVGRGAPGGSNTSAIGARVRLYAGGRWQMREIAPASPGNHVGLTVHFGLGAAAEAEVVEIRWPSGIVQTLRGLAANHYHTINEPADVTPTSTPTPTATLTATVTPSPTPTPSPNACLSDTNANGRVDVGDIMATAQAPRCQVYLPLVASQWRQPWTDLTPTPTGTPTQTPDTQPPQPPQGLASEPGDGKAHLTWHANPEPDLAGYRLYRAEAGGEFSPVTDRLIVTTAYTDTGLTNEVPYLYRLTAVDTVGNESAPSDTVEVTPDDVTFLGPEEIVFDWSEEACDNKDVPDMPARAFRDARGRLQLVAGHNVSRRLVGPDFDHLTRDCTVLMSSHFDADPAQFNDQEWTTSPYTLDGETVYALVHNEYRGHTHRGRCPSGDRNKCWYNAITLAVSTDGGDSYAHAPAPGHLIASVPYTYMPDTGPYGMMSPSNIVRHPTDGYYYAMVRILLQPRYHPPGYRGTCVMRTDGSDFGVWRAWDGAGFNMRFINPYTSTGLSAGLEPGEPIEEHVCTPVSTSEISTMHESLTYNTYFDRFLLVGLAGKWDPELGKAVWGIYYSLSDDLIHWTPRRLIREVTTVQQWQPGGPDPIAYPSILDHDSPARSFDTSGKRVYLYFTRFNYSSGQFLNRDLVRVPIEFFK